MQACICSTLASTLHSILLLETVINSGFNQLLEVKLPQPDAVKSTLQDAVGVVSLSEVFGRL